MNDPKDFEERGKRGYIYRKSDTRSRNPYEWKTCVGCGQHRLIKRGCEYCSKSCAQATVPSGAAGQAGSAVYNWKGDDAGYSSKHKRISRKRGSAKECVWVCTEVARYEWAHRTGETGDVDE